MLLVRAKNREHQRLSDVRRALEIESIEQKDCVVRATRKVEMVWPTGLEPVVPCLANRRDKPITLRPHSKIGAPSGTRTHGLLHGKQMF